jgi:hypothetical protein
MENDKQDESAENKATAKEGSKEEAGEKNKEETAENQDQPVNKSNVVIGDRNITDLKAGGDINIISQLHRPDFFTPYLDDYIDQKFTGPAITRTLVEVIRRERFLLLGGEGYDKSGLARHIAWKLSVLSNGKIPYVKEWDTNQNPQNLVLHIQKEKNADIFILPDISPQHVDYDLSALYRTTQHKNHYVVVSTNHPFKKWKLEQDVKRLSWQPAPGEPLYESRDLVNLLLNQLADNNKTLPPGLKGKVFTADGPLIENLQIKNVAEELKTPDSIHTFVKSLTTVNTTLNRSVVEEVLDNCCSDKRTLRQWFYHSLSSRAQLIAIGLCLFEGLNDDQFFAAMDALVEHSWHKKDTTLQRLDYYDIEELGNYYRLKSLGQSGLKQIESPLPELRHHMLETIWNTHRRQILSTLPVIEKLIIDSVAFTPLNAELYGNYERRRLLREVMGETLCHIGLKFEGSIQGALLEHTLLNLAAAENLGVQSVVARAIARWRFYDQDDKLFDTLHRWQEDKILKLLNSIQGDVRYTENSKVKEVFIKTTVALTVGYAAQYDPPNQLNQKLCDLLPQLAKDCTNKYIRNGFTRYTLPLVVRYHAAQVREMLYEMVKENELREYIGASLMTAVQEGVEEAAVILDTWFQRCEQERPRHYQKDETTHRDKVTATIAYAYGWLRAETEDHGEKDCLIKMADGFQRLGAILQKESHPIIRQATMIAIIRQLFFQFDNVHPHFKKLLSFLYGDERDLLALVLVDLHLDRRADLENGENSFEWEQRKFPVWIHREPSFTTVETTMKKWFKEKDSTAAAQLALKFMLSDKLNDFREKEKEFIDQHKEEEKKTPQNRQNNLLSTEPIPYPNEKNKLSIRVVSWWVAMLQPHYRENVRALLPQQG